MREEIQAWWEQSKRDLEAARHSLSSGDYEWACFQVEQSIEKALKALYLKEKGELPKSHNLVRLGKELGLNEELIDILRDITPDYVMTRYPNAANSIPYEIYDKEKAEERIKEGEKILKWIEGRLRS